MLMESVEPRVLLVPPTLLIIPSEAPTTLDPQSSQNVLVKVDITNPNSKSPSPLLEFEEKDQPRIHPKSALKEMRYNLKHSKSETIPSLSPKAISKALHKTKKSLLRQTLKGFKGVKAVLENFGTHIKTENDRVIREMDHVRQTKLALSNDKDFKTLRTDMSTVRDDISSLTTSIKSIQTFSL